MEGGLSVGTDGDPGSATAAVVESLIVAGGPVVDAHQLVLVVAIAPLDLVAAIVVGDGLLGPARVADEQAAVGVAELLAHQSVVVVVLRRPARGARCIAGALAVRVDQIALDVVAAIVILHSPAGHAVVVENGLAAGIVEAPADYVAVLVVGEFDDGHAVLVGARPPVYRQIDDFDVIAVLVVRHAAAGDSRRLHHRHGVGIEKAPFGLVAFFVVGAGGRRDPYIGALPVAFLVDTAHLGLQAAFVVFGPVAVDPFGAQCRPTQNVEIAVLDGPAVVVEHVGDRGGTGIFERLGLAEFVDHIDAGTALGDLLPMDHLAVGIPCGDRGQLFVVVVFVIPGRDALFVGPQRVVAVETLGAGHATIFVNQVPGEVAMTLGLGRHLADASRNQFGMGQLGAVFGAVFARSAKARAEREQTDSAQRKGSQSTQEPRPGLLFAAGTGLHRAVPRRVTGVWRLRQRGLIEMTAVIGSRGRRGKNAGASSRSRAERRHLLLRAAERPGRCTGCAPLSRGIAVYDHRRQWRTRKRRLQGFSQLAVCCRRVGIAPPRVAVDAAGKPRVEHRGPFGGHAQFGSPLRGRWHRRKDLAHDHRDRRVLDIARAPEESPGEQAKRQKPQRPDIGGRHDMTAGVGLLRRHVERRAHGLGASRGLGLGDHLGDAEIQDFDRERNIGALRRGHKNVLGLDVSVHDTGSVAGAEGVAQLGVDRHHIEKRQGPALPQILLEAGALEQLHHDVGHLGFVVDASAHHLHHVFAADLGADLGLLLEAPAQLFVERQLGVHELECPLGSRAQLLDDVDRSHAALAQRAHHAKVAGEDMAGHELNDHGRFLKVVLGMTLPCPHRMGSGRSMASPCCSEALRSDFILL